MSAASRPAPAWRLRAAEERDLAGFAHVVQAFITSVSSPSVRQACSEDYYRWKFLGGPFGAAAVRVADDGGRVVGTNATYAQPIWALGQSTVGAELSDLYVDARYQGQGMSSRLLRSATDGAVTGGRAIIYGTPNDVALPIEQKVGYQLVTHARVVALVRPIDYSAVVAGQIEARCTARFPSLAARHARVVEGVARLAGVLAIPAGALYERARLRRSELGGVDEVFDFPDDVDALWREVRKDYDFAIDRSASYLRWRYLAHPDATRFRFVVRREQGRLRGYAVTKLERGRNLRIGYLADWVAPVDDEAGLAALVDAAVEGLKRAGAQIATTWVVEGSTHDRVLRSLGFRRHGDVPVIVFGTPEGQRVLAEARRWHFTLGDADSL